MCDKCVELDKKLEQYRRIASSITDELTIARLNKLIKIRSLRRLSFTPIKSDRAASVRLSHPPLAVAPLAAWRINFAAWLCGLLYRREAGPLACRTFMLSRLRGQHRHLVPLWHPSPCRNVSKLLAERYQLAVEPSLKSGPNARGLRGAKGSGRTSQSRH
jgi:hypothetical protein